MNSRMFQIILNGRFTDILISTIIDDIIINNQSDKNVINMLSNIGKSWYHGQKYIMINLINWSIINTIKKDDQ